jgi:hypothetical protein
VALGAGEHLVDVVDDADLLVEAVGERELLLARRAVQRLVDAADELRVLRQAEGQQVRGQAPQQLALAAAEGEGNLAALGEEARPRPAVVELDDLRVERVEHPRAVDAQLVGVDLALRHAHGDRPDPARLAQEAHRM